MNQIQHRRGWALIAVIAIVAALVLLLIPHGHSGDAWSVAGDSAASVCRNDFAAQPACRLWPECYAGRTPDAPVLPASFQRPPPFSIRLDPSRKSLLLRALAFNGFVRGLLFLRSSCLRFLRVLMSAGVFSISVRCCCASPFLAIVAILVHYRDAPECRGGARSERGRRILGFCPSSAALGTAFLIHAGVSTGPAWSLLIEARIQQEEKAEEDDQGDPETPEKLLQPPTEADSARGAGGTA